MNRAKHQGVDSGARARLGAAALGLGGLAFAVIQILQGTVSAFDPWSALLRASGDDGERGRRLLAAAEVVLDDGSLVTATQIGIPGFVKGLQTVAVAINLFRLSTSSARVSAQRLCASRTGPLITTIPRPVGADFKFTLRDRAPRLRRLSQMLSASGPRCFY